MAPSTVAAPLMSNFISSMAGGSLREIPPESNVIPLPTRQMGGTLFLAPRYSQTISRGGWSEPLVTARNAPIFRALMPRSSKSLAVMLGHCLANACVRLPRYVGVHTLGGRFARSRASEMPLPTAAPISRPSAAALESCAFSVATLTLARRGDLGLVLVFRSGIL